MTRRRRESLRTLLTAKRQAADAAMRSRIRHGRVHPPTIGDELEQADTSSQSDIEFALVQLRAETLDRVKEALARLDAGQYGTCVDCEDQIAESRLRALPFAARCRGCAEQDEARSRQSRRSTSPDLARLSPFATVVGP